MSLWDNVKKFAQPYSDDDYDDYDEDDDYADEYEEPAETPARRSPRRAPAPAPVAEEESDEQDDYGFTPAPAASNAVSAGFGGQVLVRVVGHIEKAESLAVVVKPLRADARSDVHEGDVAGVLYRLRQVLRAVSPRFPAAYRACAPDYIDITSAVKAAV